MKVAVVCAAILLGFVVACGNGNGGDDAEVLHLGVYDISEEDFRAMLSGWGNSDLLSFAFFCQRVSSSSTEGTAYLRDLLEDLSEQMTFEGSTPVAGQGPAEASLLRAKEIIQQECAEQPRP